MNKTTGRVGTSEEISLNPHNVDQTATLKAWLMHLPGQHPFWAHYMFGVVHLRPIAGGRPPVKQAPDAEHEMIVVALDPHRKPSADDINTLIPLTPVNYVVQFAGMTDAQAIETATLLVNSFIEGGFLVEPQGIVGARDHFFGKVQRYITDYLPNVRMYREK